ncbi:MAG: efflux RND transporter periplasmic adaptor subunit [Myxococcales bacterium]|nr:efflux RND transporter periplasmic adaptor subunit [Myxococcota bacterium]MDW8282746.1 efflux RND transporter periplasmic adaptor subunit [Myxococcales bacterium]
MRRWLAVGAIMLAVAGSGVGWLMRRPTPPAYLTQVVTRGEVVSTVRATGVVQPVVLSPVGSQVSGIVWKIHADWNDRVKEGQVLLELDPALFRAAVLRETANLKTAEAEVHKAQAARTDARLQVERARQLAEQHFISAAERDSAEARMRQAEADVAAAEARLAQARAALQRAELDLRNSVVRSPVDGVVIARNVEVGQAVVASFQAPNLFTIAGDLRRMQVLANVDEADIGMIRLGQEASFSVDAYRGRRFSGRVVQVRNAAQTVQNVVTYVVVVEVDNEELLLKPGMTANVRMETARKRDVLLVPNAALRFKPKANGRRPEPARTHEHQEAGPGRPVEMRQEEVKGVPGTVYVLEGQALRAVPVRIGITDGIYSEVLAGLREGQQVVTDLARPPAPVPGGTPMAPQPGGGLRRGGF